MKERKLQINQASAHLSRLRISTQKLNLVVDTIRGKYVNAARNILLFSKRRIASDIKKLLDSAVANAEHNHGLNIDTLFIKEVWTGKSIRMKRFIPCGRGKGGCIVKQFSNVTIILQSREGI